MKKVAILDVGSNSLRLLLGTYENGVWHNEPKRLWSTRLGDRSPEGLLTDAAKERSLVALQEINELMVAYGATERIGLATSAMREAPNGQAFAKEMTAVCPMDLRIISGEEEARLGFLGATSDLVGDGLHYTVIDIGGGSTELALGDASGAYWKKSYPVGAVRLLGLSQEGPQAVWRETEWLWDRLPLEGEYGGCVAIGGTATTLAAMDLKMVAYDGSRIQGHMMRRETLECMVMDLRNMSLEERYEVPGLPKGRADIVVPGAEILLSMMDTYGLPCIRVSERDAMEAMQSCLV